MVAQLPRVGSRAAKANVLLDLVQQVKEPVLKLVQRHHQLVRSVNVRVALVVAHSFATKCESCGRARNKKSLFARDSQNNWMQLSVQRTRKVRESVRS